MSQKKYILYFWLTSVSFCFSTSTVLAETLPDDSWLLPYQVNQRHKQLTSEADLPDVTQHDVYEFAWQSFIALNWPHATGQARGKPVFGGSPAPIVNDTFPLEAVVWESYMKPGQVFVAPKGWGVTWGTADTQLQTNGIKLLEAPAYSNTFAPGINQPYTNANVPTGPITSQNHAYLWYEVTMNQSYFSYVKQFKYYNGKVQKMAVANYLEFTNSHDSAPLPVQHKRQKAVYFQPVPMGNEFYVENLPPYAQQGLVEVKASWKILKTSGENADVPGRYFRRLIKFKLPDGSTTDPILAGLTGLHIHRVTPPLPQDKTDTQDFPNHLPSTFEHVDNVNVSDIDCRAPQDMPKPTRPMLNPGPVDGIPAQYLNGYEINAQQGVGGKIPAPFFTGDILPDKNTRQIVNVSRVTPIPDAVQRINEKYQQMLKGSVWCYYQLIGTQNKNLQEHNPHLGPGITGPQTSSVQNLVNSTLESYTQKGFSCARCHLNAFPQGVKAFPAYEKKFEPLHVMSFLLQTAQSQPKRKKHAALPPGRR